MIDIPEERILKEITDILMNDLPKVLLELEEQAEDSIRLPPFRYVGLEENLPPGTGLPYAFIDIEEGVYTTKDRIIKNVIYTIRLTIKVMDRKTIWRYMTVIITVIKNSSSKYRTEIVKTSNAGLLILRITIKK